MRTRQGMGDAMQRGWSCRLTGAPESRYIARSRPHRSDSMPGGLMSPRCYAPPPIPGSTRLAALSRRRPPAALLEEAPMVGLAALVIPMLVAAVAVFLVSSVIHM